MEELKILENNLKTKRENLLIRAIKGRAKTFFDTGHYHCAMDDYQQLQKLYTHNNKLMCEVLFEIGFIHEQLGHHKKGKPFYEKVYNIALKEKLPFWKGRSLIGKAFVSYLDGDHHSALKLSNKSLHTFKTIVSEDKNMAEKINKNIASVLNNLGVIYLRLGKYKKSEDMFNKSVAIDKKIGDKLQEGKKYNNIGVIYRNRNMHKKALQYYLRALKIFEELEANHDRASVLNNIGLTHYYLGNYTTSLEYLNLSLKISETLGLKRNIGSALHNIANVYYDTEKHKRAYKLYMKSIETKKSIDDKWGVAMTQKSIADMYKNLEDYQNALKNYHSALSTWKAIRNNRGIALIYLKIAEIHASQKNPEQALQYLERAILFAKKEEIETEIYRTFCIISRILKNKEKTKKAQGFMTEAKVVFKKLGAKGLLSKIENQQNHQAKN
jgi:tetratricopeptide (TPR) repeat protein